MPYNLKEIFSSSFKAANPGININPGFPVYDTMITTNERAFEALSGVLTDLERKLDYAQFFDDDGVLLLESDFNILKNNLFLGDGMAVRSYGTVLLEFSALQDTIVIGADTKLEREGYIYSLAPGTHSLPVHSVAGRLIRYALPIVSVETGTPSVSAGIWAVNTGSLPLACLRAFTETATVAGGFNAGVLTKDNVPLLMSRKALDTKASILYALNNTLAASGVIPDRMTAAGYEDREYQSGIVPFEDDSEDVRVFRFGGYVDVRFHQGFAVEEFYFENASVYGDGLYRYYFTSPVYAVVQVRSWIEGGDGTDLRYTFDYSRNCIITASQRIRVTVVTTPSSVWTQVASGVAGMLAGAGTVKLLPFYSIRVYADDDCVPVAKLSLLTEVNDALAAYLETGVGPGEVTYDILSAAVKDATGVVLNKLKYILPDGTADDLTTGSLTGFTVPYGPENLTVDIPLTAVNTIITGGYSGVALYGVLGG